jgi:aryl-alcohol dehydrogenase-like predicted oxidoreductase
MEYATLGRTGQKVSRLGFGGATAGIKGYLGEFDPERREDRDAIIASVHRALELGVNYFDTAPGYGDGASESIFGEALEGRSDVFIATKHGYWSKEPVRAAVEKSLQRLRRDKIDLLQIHGTTIHSGGIGKVLDKGGMLDQFEELRDEGLVRWLGFTSEDHNDSVYQLIRTGRFDVMQICYNFVYQHAYDPVRPFGALFEAEEQKMGIVTMRTTTTGTFQRWMKMIRPDDDFNYTPALIQFVLSNRLVDVALVGMRNPREVEMNAALVDDPSGRVDVDALHNRFPGKP